MTEKRFRLDDFDSEVEMLEFINIQSEIISALKKKNEQLKQDVDYWNQVANQEHCKKYKTACKNIYYRRNDNND